MSARRRPDDANARWIDAPIRGARADESHGAGGVLEHDRMAIAVRPEAVLDDEGVEALLVEPERVVMSFVLGEAAVTATGQDDDSGSGCVGADEERRERGNVTFLGAESARCLVGPESNGSELGVRSHGGE